VDAEVVQGTGQDAQGLAVEQEVLFADREPARGAGHAG
jgi:hypothetical protein